MIFQKHQVFRRAQLRGSAVLNDGKRAVIGDLLNISASGMLVTVVEEFSVGQRVKVVVRAERLEEPVLAIGKVVRFQKGRHSQLAVEFTTIAPQVRTLLMRCIEEIRTEGLLNSL